MDNSIIPYLFGMTFVAFLIYGFVQWKKSKKAQDRHEHSAMPPPDEASRAKAHGQVEKQPEPEMR